MHDVHVQSEISLKVEGGATLFDEAGVAGIAL